MQDAWRKEELQLLGRLEHWLKSAGGTTGFPELTERGQNIEELARIEELSEINKPMRQLGNFRENMELVVPREMHHELPTRYRRIWDHRLATRYVIRPQQLAEHL